MKKQNQIQNRNSNSKVSKKNISTQQLLRKIEEIERDIIETKWFDAYDAAESIRTSPASNYHVTPIAQGDQPFQRNGDQIAAFRLEMRWSCFTPSGQRTPAWLRRIVYIDKQSNMVDNPVFTTGGNQNALLETAITGVPAYLAPFNYLARDRYRILSDQIFQIRQIAPSQFSNPGVGTPNTETAAYNMPLHEVFGMALGSVRIKYGSNTATFPITNAIKIAFVSSVVGVDEAPVVQLTTRLFYRDA